MSDLVIAKSSAACCLRGKIHEGEAKGKIEKILDVETYIVEPAANKSNGNVVLFFPDVFGHFINNKLIMDAFAGAGYLTLGPDYFRDPSNPNENPDFDFPGWLAKHQAFSDPFVPKFVDEMKSKYGKAGTKYACVGYCYGAPYVMDQLSEKGVCSAGAFAHPAFLKESHFRHLKNPLFLSCSEIDQTFPKEFRRRAVDILDEDKKTYHVQLFQGVAHSFALRGDMSDPWQKYTKEMSFQGIQEWFDWFLSK